MEGVQGEFGPDFWATTRIQKHASMVRQGHIMWSTGTNVQRSSLNPFWTAVPVWGQTT